ncbi:DUF1566 domain-containing protein, partial [bacterium]|nr:DUF1566 domain-containing protein [bacterium]
PFPGPTPSPVHYVDNGDGTVTDLATDLQWEKKTGTVGSDVFCIDAATCPDPHGVNDRYSWSVVDDPSWSFGGTAATVFLARLNATCFAGHCDWRLPTADELGTSFDHRAPGCFAGWPCIDPVFGPTRAGSYWSASTWPAVPAWALDTHFDGRSSPLSIQKDKTASFFVRAVRSVP